MGAETNTVAAAITGAVTDMTNAIGTITGWWFVPIAVSLFGAGVVISLVASFFGKGKRRKRR